MKHIDAMEKRQAASHAEFERKKKRLEEERTAKENAELSFQPNVLRREIEALYVCRCCLWLYIHAAD